jgi:hypothetical protein
MRSSISKADYSIFDLSDWNSNVALELGLAEGARGSAPRKYYIILNTKRSKDVPSDIKGLQRMEYTTYDYSPGKGLGDQLIKYILSKEFWVKKIWAKIPEDGNGWSKRLMSLHILAFFREHNNLAPENILAIARGSRLREKDRQEVVDLLEQLGIVKQMKGTRVYVTRKTLYAKA